MTTHTLDEIIDLPVSVKHRLGLFKARHRGPYVHIEDADPVLVVQSVEEGSPHVCAVCNEYCGYAPGEEFAEDDTFLIRENAECDCGATTDLVVQYANHTDLEKVFNGGSAAPISIELEVQLPHVSEHERIDLVRALLLEGD